MEIKSKEKKIENNSKLNDNNNNILESCSNLKPLELVNTIEVLYNSILDKSEKENFRILSTYGNLHERKYDLIDFEIKTQNSKIMKKIKEITCIKIVENNLFFGVKDGYVYMYQIETGLEKETFGVENINIPVSVINNKENSHLLVGYENGCINIFDMKNKSLIKNIENIHKTRIIQLEYILIEKNNIQLISTDEEGQVINISSYNGFLSKKTVGNLIYKDPEPVYNITKFKPFEDKKIIIFGFCSPNKICLYNYNSKLYPILEIKKPKYAERNDVPDIDIGWSVPPLDESFIKNDKKINNQILLLISWGRVITINSIIIKGDNIRCEESIGFYKNNNPIIKIGFFSQSILYFFDENKQIKVLNIAFCNKGPFDENKVMNKNALVDEGKIVDKNIKFNTNIRSGERKFNNYKNYIISLNNYIYLFTDDGLRIGKILNYMEYIDNIINSGNNWKAAMCLAIDIFKGEVMNFPGIPLNKVERKKRLKNFLVELLNKFIDYIFNTKSEYLEEENEDDKDNSINNIIELNEDKIIECINISIEFCLEIKSIDFLLKDVEPTFSKYGREDLFYKLLEPFIFNDLFNNEEIGIEALTSLYGTYKIKGEIVLFSHLLTHINLKCLNNFMIKKISIQENLFDLIIYIFSNGTCCEDFFLPITKMYECYNKLESNKEEYKEENEYKYISYYDLYIKKGIAGINKMELSKEYIGHKLLWYIDMCFRGKKIYSGIEIDLSKFQVDSKEYNKLISYIYFWILHEDIFFTLLKFDSYTLFSILNYAFTEQRIINIIKNFDFSIISADSLNELIKQQENGSYLVTNISKKKEDKEKEIKNKDEKEEDEKENEVEQEKGEIDEKKEEEKKLPEMEEDFDPFALKGKSTIYGEGVKLNNINSILEYIFDMVESQSQSNYISKLDLNLFLMKYISSNKEEKISEKIHKKVLDAFIYCLKFFTDYKMKRKDLIEQNEDKFNIHYLSNRIIDTQNPFFCSVLSTLNDLITSENIKFTEEELFKIKLASGKMFNLINIKIAELSKNYKDCMKLYLEEEDPKKRENVYSWIEEKFEFFNKEFMKENPENILIEEKKDYEKFIDSIVDKISELVKIRLEKIKSLVEKYLKNNEKIRIYYNLKGFPQEQFEFLENLLYQNLKEKKEEEGDIPEDNLEKQKTNIDLFQLFINNMDESNKNINQEKIYREQFDNLLIDQTNLLIKLKRENDVIKYLKKDIPIYPTFPLREVLNKCIGNEIIDAAIYIYRVLNENKSSFNLTLQILDKSFNKYKEFPNEGDNDFLDKLNLSINICKENSESLFKKDPKEKSKKESDDESEKLWFDLLQKLYKYEDSLEKNKNKEIIKETLEKGISILLKEICSYVRIQQLIKYVTENQEKAQYKEYKTILEKMLRSDNSFGRVLESVKTILKKSIEESELKRKEVISKGNNYNIKKCDVCNKLFQNSKDEIVYFFGCGHQSHEKCCYKKKINSNRNRIIMNNSYENEESFLPECEVCRKNRIENGNRNENEFENFIMNEDRNFAEDIILNKDNIKIKAFKFGNKKDKFKKLNKYDNKYQNEASIFY